MPWLMIGSVGVTSANYLDVEWSVYPDMMPYSIVYLFGFILFCME